MKKLLNKINEYAYSVIGCFTFPRMVVTAALCASVITPIFLSSIISVSHDGTKNEEKIEENASTEQNLDFAMLDEIPENAGLKGAIDMGCFYKDADTGEIISGEERMREFLKNASDKVKDSIVIADVSETGRLILTEAACDEEICGIKIDFSRDDASIPSFVQYFSSVVRYDTDTHSYWMLANTDEIDEEMLEGEGLDAFVLLIEEKRVECS